MRAQRMQAKVIGSKKSKVLKWVEPSDIKTAIIDVNDLQPADGRWHISWNAPCIDDETVVDVYRCPGIWEKVAEGLEMVMKNRIRHIVVRSARGMQRGPVVAATIVDCLNMLIGDHDERLINACRFDSSVAKSNSDIDAFLDDVYSWITRPSERKVQIK